MSSPFVHLHVHSELSILDGACRIPALVDKAARLEMPAVSLTDHGSLAGAIDLYRAARTRGVKPILGCEAYVVDDRTKQHKGHAHLTLLAESNEGYGNLIKLCSLGYLEGYYYRPRVDWELLSRHAKGLIALSGCLSGRVSRAITENRLGDAELELDRLEQIFGRDNTYVELQNAGLEVQRPVYEALPRLAAKRGLPLVATGDVHYLDASDAYAHEALLCIQSGDSLKNPARWRFETNEFYFKTPEEMALDFPGHEEALRRTLEVAERCRVEIELDRILLPSFPTPDGRDAFDYLVELCEHGLVTRYGSSTPELLERLRFELKTIREMGFADYFLIVADFIAFAKRDGVAVGPGRGSAAGSVVAYCLGITDIDPIRYDLLFERFLNPGRKSMPDIDIDFAVDGRERVINYVADKYGRDRVAQIITFSTMAARAAIRDAGRVLEIPYGTVDKIAKLVPEGPGQTLEDGLRPGGELRQAYDADPVAREIVDLARPLEGLTRADSIHAAGVVIGAEPLIETIPLQQKGPDAEVVTQFSMGNVEALGLLKMDFLGLRNLDVIETAVRLVGGDLDITTIPLDDRATYEMLARGESTGVFQFESSGMREALRQVRPTEFEDLIALVALYRPGPMAYIPTYAARKAGREPVSYPDERLRAITGGTYGTCLTGDTLVFDASSGRRVRIDELQGRDEVIVQGVDHDLSPSHARVTAWMDNGVRPVYRVRLRNGATVKATADHRFLAETGWVELRDLRVGERLATPPALIRRSCGRWLGERERARYRGTARLIGLDCQHFHSDRARIGARVVAPVIDRIDLPDAERASRVCWHEIVAIEPAGAERVYDITVEGIHNFVANGVIVHNCIYQEQYMEIAKTLAGFTPAEADDLRKAIGKKIHALMASLKEQFLDGCARNGVAAATARALWDDMEKAQDYSFNKSHAACYALIAYRTAWLRANHPHAYMAALISSVMNTKDRVPLYVAACEEMGIEVLPPDVNESATDFAVVEGKIRFGLNAVKNVGDAAARAIVAAREGQGRFASIWDFTERVDPQVVNKRALESLVKCGALDSTGASRLGMLGVVEQALAYGQKLAADRLAGQASFFDGDFDPGAGAASENRRHHPSLPSAEFDKGELLRLEKETLGLYVSEHPLDAVRESLRRRTDATLAELERRRDGEIVTVGGIVSAVKQLTTKRGEPMVFLTLDDPTGTAEAVVFATTYATARELCVADRVVVVKGRVDHKQQGETKLVAMELTPFEAVPERRDVRFRIDARQAAAGVIRELARLVREYPGDSPVYVALETSLGSKTLALGADYRVQCDPDFLTEAKALLGDAAVGRTP